MTMTMNIDGRATHPANANVGNNRRDPPQYQNNVHYHSLSLTNMHRNGTIGVRAGGGRSHNAGHSEGEEREWRSIREPIMEILSRSSSALNNNRQNRSLDPEDTIQEDASGIYSTGSSKQSGMAKEDAFGIYSRGGASITSDNINNVRDMQNHPKGGNPKKDKDSDVEALGGFGVDQRNRVKFADQIFGRGQVQASNSDRVQQPIQQQQQQLRPSWNKNINNTSPTGSVDSAPEKSSIDSSSYNISAFNNQRQKHRKYMQKNAAKILAIVLMVVVAGSFALNYLRKGSAGTDGVGIQQRAMLQDGTTAEGVMDVANDIPLKQPPSTSNLRGSQDQQLEIQNEMLRVQKEILNAKSQPVISQDAAVKTLLVGKKARAARKQKKKEEAYQAAMEWQAREEQKKAEAVEKEAREQQELREAMEKEAQQQQRAIEEEAQQQLAEMEAAGAEQQQAEESLRQQHQKQVADEGQREGDEIVSPQLTQAEADAARQDVKALIEAARQKGAREEAERAAREKGVFVQHLHLDRPAKEAPAIQQAAQVGNAAELQGEETMTISGQEAGGDIHKELIESTSLVENA